MSVWHSLVNQKQMPRRKYDIIDVVEAHRAITRLLDDVPFSALDDEQFWKLHRLRRQLQAEAGTYQRRLEALTREFGQEKGGQISIDPKKIEEYEAARAELDARETSLNIERLPLDFFRNIPGLRNLMLSMLSILIDPSKSGSEKKGGEEKKDKS